MGVWASVGMSSVPVLEDPRAGQEGEVGKGHDGARLTVPAVSGRRGRQRSPEWLNNRRPAAPPAWALSS